MEHTSDSKVSLRSRDASLGAGPQDAALASFGSFTREPRLPPPPRVNACDVGWARGVFHSPAVTFEPAARFARFPRLRTRGVAPHAAAASRRRSREILQCHRPYEHVHVLRSLATPSFRALGSFAQSRFDPPTFPPENRPVHSSLLAAPEVDEQSNAAAGSVATSVEIARIAFLG
jgi:hypothetical protein